MTDSEASYLPLFPLELAVFPGQDLPLHIFEPRYRELIRECRDTGITFGIPAYEDGHLHAYGTEMQLVSIETVYDDGRMDILTCGLRCFRLMEVLPDVPGRLYSAGKVAFLPNDEDGLPEAGQALVEAYEELHRLAGIAATGEVPTGPGLSFQIAHSVGLNLEQKMRLVAMAKESERQAFLMAHLQRTLAVLERASELKKLTGGNGHAKKFPPQDR